MNVINLPARDWAANDTNTGGDRLASVTVLADHAACNQRRPRRDANDWHAFDSFIDTIRSMTDAELANRFHAGPDLVAQLREFAS